MKKKFFLLPCIAAVAIATFVGAKTFKSNATESNNLLLENVEALASSEGSYGCSATAYCFSMGRITGEISCSGTYCERGYEWVKCNGRKTTC